MTEEISSRWDAPLPRYVFGALTERLMRCVCTDAWLCMFHGAQRDRELADSGGAE